MANGGRLKLLRAVSRIAYNISKSMYGPLKRLFRPFVLQHPRLHRFLRNMKEPLKELLRSPDAVTIGGPPGVSPIPDWLIEEWKEIHEIEPRIYPEKWLLEGISFYLYDMPDSAIGQHYLELCTSYGQNVSHVFLLPWLLKGGADLVALNYINAITKQSPLNRVTVIVTLDADSPWKERLPNGVRFVEFGKKYGYLAPDEQEVLLTRVLLQMAPKVIHNVNSDLGYRVVVKYGKALSSVSNLYASSFCIDLASEGNLAGYPVWYLPNCFDYLKAIFSDNQTHLDRLNRLYAFDSEKMIVHYQPMNLATREPKSIPANKERLDILWAGRLDIQKRPDILIRIAEKCLPLPLSFHVYGSPVMDMNIYTKEFSRLPNIMYHGGFDGLSSLPIQQYDIFLYTSQWDGLPNVLLEAISLGFPVIAADVGGISELIIDSETGFLVNPFDDTDKYVERLSRVISDRPLARRVAENALALVSKRHSWEVFRAAMQYIYDFRRITTV